MADASLEIMTQRLKQLESQLSKINKNSDLLSRSMRDQIVFSEEMNKSTGDIYKNSKGRTEENEKYNRSLSRSNGLLGNMKTLVRGIGAAAAGMTAAFQLGDIIRDAFVYNQQMTELSFRMGEAGKTAQALGDAIYEVSFRTGIANEKIIETIIALKELRVGQESLVELAEAATRFTEITGAASDSVNQMTGEFVRAGGLGTKSINNILTGVVKIQRGMGLSSKEVTSLTNQLSLSAKTLSQFGKGAGDVERFTVGTAKLAGAFANVGIEAEKALTFVDELLDPGAIEKNALLYAKLGVSLSDVIEGNVDPGQLIGRFKTVGIELKNMTGPAANALAESMGMSLRDLRQMAKMADSYIDPLSTQGKELAKAQADQATAQKKIEYTWNRIKTVATEFVSKVLPIIEPFINSFANNAEKILANIRGWFKTEDFVSFISNMKATAQNVANAIDKFLGPIIELFKDPSKLLKIAAVIFVAFKIIGSQMFKNIKDAIINGVAEGIAASKAKLAKGISGSTSGTAELNPYTSTNLMGGNISSNSISNVNGLLGGSYKTAEKQVIDIANLREKKEAELYQLEKLNNLLNSEEKKRQIDSLEIEILKLHDREASQQRRLDAVRYEEIAKLSNKQIAQAAVQENENAFHIKKELDGLAEYQRKLNKEISEAKGTDSEKKLQEKLNGILNKQKELNKELQESRFLTDLINLDETQRLSLLEKINSELNSGKKIESDRLDVLMKQKGVLENFDSARVADIKRRIEIEPDKSKFKAAAFAFADKVGGALIKAGAKIAGVLGIAGMIGGFISSAGSEETRAKFDNTGKEFYKTFSGVAEKLLLGITSLFEAAKPLLQAGAWIGEKILPFVIDIASGIVGFVSWASGPILSVLTLIAGTLVAIKVWQMATLLPTMIANFSAMIAGLGMNAAAGAGVAAVGAGAATVGMGAAISGLAATIAPILPPLLLVVAAMGTLGFVISESIKESKRQREISEWIGTNDISRHNKLMQSEKMKAENDKIIQKHNLDSSFKERTAVIGNTFETEKNSVKLADTRIALKELRDSTVIEYKKKETDALKNVFSYAGGGRQISNALGNYQGKQMSYFDSALASGGDRWKDEVSNLINLAGLGTNQKELMQKYMETPQFRELLLSQKNSTSMPVSELIASSINEYYRKNKASIDKDIEKAASENSVNDIGRVYKENVLSGLNDSLLKYNEQLEVSDDKNKFAEMFKDSKGNVEKLQGVIGKNSSGFIGAIKDGDVNLLSKFLKDNNISGISADALMKIAVQGGSFSLGSKSDQLSGAINTNFGSFGGVGSSSSDSGPTLLAAQGGNWLSKDDTGVSKDATLISRGLQDLKEVIKEELKKVGEGVNRGANASELSAYELAKQPEKEKEKIDKTARENFNRGGGHY